MVFQTGMLAAAPSRWWGWGRNRVEQLDLSLPGISPVPIASPFLADKIIIIFILFFNSSVYLPTPCPYMWA